jgi:DNA polymerase-4
VEIKPAEVQEFLRDLPISKLWGVGKSTEETLKDMGILRVGQLAAYPAELIERKLGKFGLELVTLARGEDDRPVIPESEAKSISQEETFTPDLRDLETMKKVLLDQSEQVGWELRKQGLKGYTVQLKVRYPDFSLITRSFTLPAPTDQGIEIYQNALKLLDKTDALTKRARLLGVGVSKLRHRDDPEQMSLFDFHKEKVERSTAVVDQIWDRFGPEAIKRASLVKKIKKKGDREMGG